VEVALKVLHREKRAMTAKEIMAVAIRDFGLRMDGKTPDATLNANFINEIKRRAAAGREQRFVRVAPGLWGLVQFLGKHYRQKD
jgi:hypothetical protein